MKNRLRRIVVLVAVLAGLGAAPASAEGLACVSVRKIHLGLCANSGR